MPNLTPSPVPPIPVLCAHRPTIGGRVIPYVNVQLADGGVDFRRQHRTRAHECLLKGLCQVCGLLLAPPPIVLLGGPTDLKHLLFGEPGVHPACGVYTTRACPMVAGELTKFADGPSVSEGHRGKRCFEPGCDCGGWVDNDPHNDHCGKPAHEWYAVYVGRYTVATNPAGDYLRALVLPEDVLKVRLVSRPGEGRCWETVEDPLAGYEPPKLAAAKDG